MFDKRLMKMAPETRPWIIASVLLQWVALMANIVFIIATGFVAQAFLEGTITTNSIGMLGLVVAGAMIIRTFCLTQTQRAGVKAANLAKRKVRTEIYSKLVKLGPSYNESVSTAEAVQICVEGTEQLEGYFGAYLPQFFYALLAPLTLFACLAPLCLPAAVALLVCVPLIPLSIVAVQKIAKRVMGNYWGSYINLGETFLENLQGLTTLKIFQADGTRHQQMNEESERFRKATMKLLSMQLNSVTVMDLFAYGGAAVGVIIAALQFASGTVPFFAAFAVVFLAAEFFLPLRALGSFFHTAMGGMAVADKIFHILGIPEPVHGSRAIDPNRANLSCHNLTYSYDDERLVLDHVDFETPTNSFIGIVGESGSGKSTLAAILSGRISGYEGTVMIGDLPLKETSLASLAYTVTVVPHASHLFKGTLRENLLMADPQATDHDLWEALARWRSDAFVRELGGLDAQILEDGSNLSGGQRQRIALARALLHNTPVYIFDEATSNVDVESEEAIIEAIHELARTKTVIMIAHRLFAVKEVNQIYVMDQGKIAEKGTHEELLAKGGQYAHLWKTQAALEAITSQKGNTAHMHSSNGSLAAPLASAESPATATSATPAAENTSSPARSAASQNRPDSPTRSYSHGGVMKGLIGMVRPLIGFMLLAVGLGVLGFVAAIFLTVFGMYALMDTAGFSLGLGVTVALVLVGVCGIVRGPLRYGEQICNHYLAFKILALMRDRVFAALRKLAPAKLEGRDKGDLISLITSDIELLEVFYAHTVSPVLIALIVSIGMVVYLGTFSIPLALLALASYLVIGVLMPLVASKASKDSGRVLREGLASINAFVLDSLRGLRETLQFNQTSQRKSELAKRMDVHAVTERKLKGKTALFSALTSALILALDFLMIACAGQMVISGSLSAGAALVAITAFMSSFGPVVAVANLGSTLQQTIASSARVLELLDEVPQTEEITQGAKLDSFTGASTYSVDFSYECTPILQNVDLTIEPGSIVQIAGRSGSGKSTLCKLLLRFWDTTRGVIEISDFDIRQIETKSLRAHESYLAQDTHLFTGTLAENILIAKPHATQQELEAACKKAALTEFLARLPKGLETPVGELGDTLSGGECQRIGLARMFLCDAPFMLLDEPTSNLDSLNEASILQAINDGRDERTVLLVSHRISTASIADTVITVENGRVS